MKKALLVDDDYLVRSYLKMLPSWEKAGFAIDLDVRDGEEALERLEKGDIDLVVTDIAMPLMDGIELIRQIRKKFQGIYVIVLSCHDEFGYVKKAMQEGADEYVLKNTLDEESLYRLLMETREKMNHLEAVQTEKGKKSQETEGLNGNQKFLFFNQILAGALKMEDREEQRQKAGIRGRYQNSGVILMKLQGFEASEDPLEEAKIDQYCLDFWGRFLQKLKKEENKDEVEKEVIYLGRGVLCCFVDLSEDCKNSVMYQRLMNISSLSYKICKEESYPFLIGVSTVGIGADALQQGYQQARMMIKAGFYEENEIIYFDRQKLVSTELPEEAREVLEYMDKFHTGGQKEQFLQMTEGALGAFRRERTEGSRVIQWVKSLEHGIAGEELSDSGRITGIREVEDIIQRISERLFSREELDIPQELSNPVKAAVEYASFHYREDIGLNDAAEAAGVNSTYLSYLFGQEMKIGFTNYVIRLRVDCARKLLCESTLKIRQVAEKSGFHDYHYFSKVFKKITGLSAAQYRKEHTER